MQTILDFLRYDESGRLSLTAALAAALIGITAAIIILYIRNKYAGKLIRALSEKRIRTAEEALTLEELGIEPNGKYEKALKKGSALRRLVLSANADTEDIRQMRFYLPTENEEKALVSYGAKDRNALLIPFLLLILAAVVLGAASLLPEAISAIGEFLAA